MTSGTNVLLLDIAETVRVEPLPDIIGYYIIACRTVSLFCMRKVTYLRLHRTFTIVYFYLLLKNIYNVIPFRLPSHLHGFLQIHVCCFPFVIQLLYITVHISIFSSSIQVIFSSCSSPLNILLYLLSSYSSYHVFPCNNSGCSKRFHLFTGRWFHCFFFQIIRLLNSRTTKHDVGYDVGHSPVPSK